MEAANWTPVGIVLAIATGVVSLSTMDPLTITVVIIAFCAGVFVGRESNRQPRRTVDEGIRE